MHPTNPSRRAANIKGSVLSSRLDYLRSHRGGEGLERVLKILPEGDQRILRAGVLHAGWFPAELGARLDEAIARETGEGELTFVKLGAHSAAFNLEGPHKVYVRSRDPHGLLKHAAAIFALYYDVGHRTYERVSDKKAVLHTHGSPAASRADCLTVVGWHQRAIELCGGRNVRVTEPRCAARGDAVCEHVCEWE